MFTCASFVGWRHILRVVGVLIVEVCAPLTLVAGCGKRAVATNTVAFRSVVVAWHRTAVTVTRWDWVRVSKAYRGMFIHVHQISHCCTEILTGNTYGETVRIQYVFHFWKQNAVLCKKSCLHTFASVCLSIKGHQPRTVVVKWQTQLTVSALCVMRTVAYFFVLCEKYMFMLVDIINSKLRIAKISCQKLNTAAGYRSPVYYFRTAKLHAITNKIERLKLYAYFAQALRGVAWACAVAANFNVGDGVVRTQWFRVSRLNKPDSNGWRHEMLLDLLTRPECGVVFSSWVINYLGDVTDIRYGQNLTSLIAVVLVLQNLNVSDSITSWMPVPYPDNVVASPAKYRCWHTAVKALYSSTPLSCGTSMRSTCID